MVLYDVVLSIPLVEGSNPFGPIFFECQEFFLVLGALIGDAAMIEGTLDLEVKAESAIPIPTNLQNNTYRETLLHLFSKREIYFFGLAMRYVHNRADADDLLQETAVKLVKLPNDYRKNNPYATDETVIGSFLTNVIRDYLRGYGKAPVHPMGEIGLRKVARRSQDDYRYVSSSVPPSPYESARLEEVQKRYLDSKILLSDEMQQIVTLRLEQGLGGIETAEMLGVGEGHVANVLYRARQRLKGHMSQTIDSFVD